MTTATTTMAVVCVPVADSAPLSVKLLSHGTLKAYEGLPHGLCTTHPEIVNADLLAFIKA